jgi:hypothetical protein
MRGTSSAGGGGGNNTEILQLRDAGKMNNELLHSNRKQPIASPRLRKTKKRKMRRTK